MVSTARRQAPASKRPAPRGDVVRGSLAPQGADERAPSGGRRRTPHLRRTGYRGKGSRPTLIRRSLMNSAPAFFTGHQDVMHSAFAQVAEGARVGVEGRVSVAPLQAVTRNGCWK